VHAQVPDDDLDSCNDDDADVGFAGNSDMGSEDHCDEGRANVATAQSPSVAESLGRGDENEGERANQATPRSPGVQKTNRKASKHASPYQRLRHMCNQRKSLAGAAGGESPASRCRRPQARVT
jgi:hypothetical protein